MTTKSETQRCSLCNRPDPGIKQCRLSVTPKGHNIWVCSRCLDVLKKCEGRDSIAGVFMDEIEMRRESRRQKRLDQLQADDAICFGCGIVKQECIEQHHLEGQAFGETLIPLCRNCHRELSVAQREHPPQISKPPRTEESIGHFLHGLADLLVLIAEKLREFATYLIEQTRQAFSDGPEEEA